MTFQKPAPANAHRRLYRPWSVRTVVIKLSRKLTATYRIRYERSLSRLLATLLAATSTWSIAELPTGLNVVAGQATASTPTTNNMLINQGTDKAVLNWQTFNIGVGKSVQFVQPATTSVALNRIVGNEASSIYGSLSANGQVFLVNPSGVMFAPGAQVNVGGLVASSLGISNDDFMAGRYTFSGLGGGAVENHGTINAARGGYVLLAAPKVTNMGSITADAGSVGLLAGSRVTLDTSDMGLVRFSVDAAAANAAINSSGSLAAKGGQVAVLASAMGDAMATVINQSGVIRADSAVERNGMIVLSGGPTGVVKITGTLSAAGLESGQTGGTVHVLGDKVLLAPGATVDASGQSGGGTILVGGDYQGSNANVQNASRLHVAAGANLSADAISNGNGGKVVVWADGDTRFAGSIRARGGARGGDGGFVETSGKEFLQVSGEVDASAANGIGGVWLLDPRNVSITNNTTSGGAFVGAVFTPTADDATVNRNTIQTSLNAGTSVTINTVASGSQAGDITVVDSITKSAGALASLTLNAAGSIFVNNTITSTFNALNVNLNATSATTFSSAGALTTNGGNVSITGTGAKTLGTINTSGTVGTGNLTIGTAGAVTQLASTALTIKGATVITAGSANDITLNTATNNFSTVAITSGNNVSITDANALVLGASTTAASLSVVAGADITQSGIVTTPTFNAKTLSAGIANIILTNSANNVTTVNLQARNAGDTANGSGAIQYADATGFDVAAISTTGNATLSAGGVVTQSGAVTATGLALTGTGGAYTLNNAGNAITTLAANTGSVDYKQTGALIVGTVGTAGVTTTGVARIETTGVASNLTLNNAVTSSASGDAVILKAGSANAAGVSTGGQFINNVGATGIMAASGRYVVFSGAPDTTTEGMAGYSKRYNSDLNAVPATANSTFLYRIAPTLTVTANNITRVYGDSNPALTGVVNSGLIDGDTAASVGVGYATTAVARTAVAAGPVAITINVTNNENYTLATTNAALTITRRDLTVSATGQDRVFNGGTSANVVLTDNRLPGDLLTLSGVASFADAGLGSGKPINVAGISVGGVDAANYNLINTSALTTGSILRPAAATFTGQLASAMTASFIEAADRRCEAASSAAPASQRAGVLIRRQSGSTDLNCN